MSKFYRTAIIKYEIPEEEDQPGEVTVDYIPQYCLEANDDKTELTVMDGTELTFTSLGAEPCG